MLKVKFFHLPKPKQFKYTPRHFDPVREERERLKAERRKEKGEEAGSMSIHGAFTQRLASRRKTKQSSNIRLIVIIGILGLLAWWLLS
jgi:hypothetical protein